MRRGSYLRHTASRALQQAPAILPPRRVARALPEAPPDEPQPIATPRPALRASEPPVPTQPADHPRDVPAVVRGEEAVAPEVTPYAPAAATVTAPRERPRADFVFDAPRRALPPAPQITGETSVGTHARTEPPRAEADSPTGSIGHEPRHELSARPRATAPAQGLTTDPLAVALAAAARWTSSAFAPIVASRPAPAAAAGQPATRESIVHASREPSQPAAPAPLPPVPVRPALAMPARRAPAPVRPALPTPARVMPQPARPVPAGTPRDAPAPAERFTGIHIGSVQVEILPLAEPLKPPVATATAAAANAGTATPLARGLTSSIGLRQG